MKYLTFPLLLLLSACTAAPSKTYLLLQPPAQTSALEITAPVKKLNVQLSEYLNRPALAIANTRQEILFSEQYLWAERLDIALADILQQNINQQFIGKKTNTHYQLQLFVQRFHSDQKGQMIFKGEYFLRNSQGALVEQAGFSLTDDFQISDYQDVTFAMEQMLQQLAKLISQQIQLLE